MPAKTSLLSTTLLLIVIAVEAAPPTSPRFTEEREAAALYFVKKHLPELLPLFEPLKKNGTAQYQKEIYEIFRVTELLADLRDDVPRHDLELRIWITENKAQILLAKLATPDEAERKKIQMQLQELARQLVSLDVEHLELRAEMLDRELGETKEELAKIRDNRDKHIKDRFDGMLQRIAKRKKS